MAGVIGATIEERIPSERRNSRSSGDWAIRRSSSSRICGHQRGISRQARSTLTSQSGSAGVRVRIRSSISSASGRPSARVAIRVTRPSCTASTMQMSANARGDHRRHPLQRLGQRQRPVRDLADGVEHQQALRASRASAPRYHEPATARQVPSAITAMRTIWSVLSVFMFHAGLATAAAIAASPTAAVAAGPASRAVMNGAATKRADDRGRLVVEDDVGGHARGEGREPDEQPDWIAGKVVGGPSTALAQCARRARHLLGSPGTGSRAGLNLPAGLRFASNARNRRPGGAALRSGPLPRPSETGPRAGAIAKRTRKRATT